VYGVGFAPCRQMRRASLPLPLMIVRKLSTMPRISLTLVPAVLIAATLAGCSSTKDDPTAKWTPERIYTEARDESSSGAYDKAVPLFE